MGCNWREDASYKITKLIMALVAEDLNVFDLPHNHMKRLVGEIEKQVLKSDVLVCMRMRMC